MQFPSASCKRYLTVPSLDCWRRRMEGAAIVHCSSSAASKVLGWSVICGKLGHELLMQPFKNLFGAEFRLTQPHDVSCQGVQRHIRNADPFAHAGSPPFYNNEFCVTFVPGWRQKNRPSRSCGARTACPVGRYPPRVGLFPASPHGNPGWRREIFPPEPGSPYN